MRVEKQMGITHPEFFRLIPVALGFDDFEKLGDGVRWSRDERIGRITLGPENIRRIALLEVPSTPVVIELMGYDGADAEGFLVRFDRAFQRGGG